MRNPYPAKVKPKRGRPAIGPRPAKGELVRLYVRGRLSLRDTAAALGCSKDIARAALADYGIKARDRTTKRAILTDIPLSLLKANVKAEGLRAHARTLGVSASALLKHIRRMNGDT
jgi:hypothetical protein